MGFSSRLQRFAQAKEGVKPDVGGSVADASGTVATDEEVVEPKTAASAPDKQAQLLDDLRARMAKALAKHDAKRDRAKAGRDDRGEEEASRAAYREPLPLERVEVGSGSFERRLRVESALSRVGGVPLSDALEASFSWLAVLALDESLAACSLDGALFLDTETTGLAGGTGTLAFLVGLAWWSA